MNLNALVRQKWTVTLCMILLAVGHALISEDHYMCYLNFSCCEKLTILAYNSDLIKARSGDQFIHMK